MSDEDVLNLGKILADSLSNATKNLVVVPAQVISSKDDRPSAIRIRYRDRFFNKYFDQIHMVETVMAYSTTVISYELYIARAAKESGLFFC
jgi:hypothetical protein